MIGSVVVDEIVLPITGLRLMGGELRITATAHGPLPLIQLTDYAVLGADAIVVYRSARPDETVTVGPLGLNDAVTVHLGVEIDNRGVKPLGPVRVSRDGPPT